MGNAHTSHSLSETTMKMTSVKAHSTGKATRRQPATAPKNDRTTLIALYLFTGGMLMALLYFISLIFFI